MIDSLVGTLASKTPAAVTVEVGGVGFLIHIPLSTFSALPAAGQSVGLFTHLYVREDQLRLYGFATEQERELFQVLLEVNRIGPAVAVQVLSSCSVEQFRGYVSSGDVKALTSMVKGVGKKTAQRLVLELKGELTELGEEDGISPDNAAAADVIKALVELGESQSKARKMVRTAMDELGSDADEESLMREVLSG